MTARQQTGQLAKHSARARRFVCRRAGFGVSLRAFADVAHLDRVQPSEG